MTSDPDQRLQSLRDDERAGRRRGCLCFWNPDPSPDGEPGPGCLSQWWPSAFTVDGVDYPTAEHWMMAAKARRFGDHDAVRRILTDADPAQAKAAGRAVSGFSSSIWARERYDVVVAGNAAKFAQHDDLRAVLLGTGDRVLVEASPVDLVWGSGLAAADPDACSPTAWPGRNLLGLALMEVREQLAGRAG